MSVLLLSTIGGLISAGSTSLGAFMAPLMKRFDKLHKFHMSMDFALGVMLSAVAFSLVGPELLKGEAFDLVFYGLLTGSFFIVFTHRLISSHGQKTILIAALLFHNLPEGMGAGASLAGMAIQEVIPLQVALSIQNIAEGLLLTMLLQSMGMKLFHAVLGGAFSGLIEMAGAVSAGFFMQQTMNFLPFFLSLAGGAMMMSVALEMKETFRAGKKVNLSQFAWGMLVIPATNTLLG